MGCADDAEPHHSFCRRLVQGACNWRRLALHPHIKRHALAEHALEASVRERLG